MERESGEKMSGAESEFRTSVLTRVLSLSSPRGFFLSLPPPSYLFPLLSHLLHPLSLSLHSRIRLSSSRNPSSKKCTDTFSSPLFFPVRSISSFSVFPIFVFSGGFSVVMASSEGLASVEPWSFRQSFGVDSWLLPESTFSRDSDLLTRALHKSISTNHSSGLLSDPLSPSVFLDSAATSEPSPSPAPAPTLSNVSDPETAGTKRRRNGGPVAGSGGKPPKRRSRASKKSQTTFITADPANFRQMVQQVTGAKYIGSSHNIFAPIVKPEPQRLASRLSSDRSGLPTLDTSAFLSNHHQESLAAGNNTFSGSGTGLGSAPPMTSFQSTTTAADAGSSAVEFDNYPSFPTLESWKVM